VSAAMNAARALPQPDQAQAAQRDEAAWVQESFEIAQKVVHAAPIGLGPGPFTLDDAYKANAMKVATECIALAGARLANLLNNELK
jgi:S1/P1 nuclease